jgi:NAD(P)-dependent dehydrogenase (short-subunit alcohol dehydrogenase family)
VSEGFRGLVLGGSGALGRVVCRLLAAGGGRLGFTYHTNTAAARALESECDGVRGWRLDLTSVAEVERTVDEVAAAWGGLDALINCAGLGVSPGDPVPADAHQRLEDVSEPGWQKMLAVNVTGAFFSCRRAARALRQAGGGNMVLLGSLAGVKPLPSAVHFAACKGALVGITQALAKELGKDNIRVNLIVPGLTEAGMSKSLPQCLIDEYTKHCGLKRLGKLEEVAAVVAWMARHNTYVTGQTILIDGAL